MKYAVQTFVVATLLLAVAVYLLITSSTPLEPSQAVGTGVAFLLGWLGLAYAGSEALEGVLRRRRARMASGERAPSRSGAVVRRFWLRAGQPEGEPSTLSAADASSSSSGSRPFVASSERAPGRAAAVARRYTEKAVPDPALERLATDEAGADDDQALASSLTRASIASTRSTSDTRNAAS